MVTATTAKNSAAVRNWLPSMSALLLVAGGQLAGQRVELRCGVAAVEPSQRERGHELQQAENEGDVDVADELGAHEVGRPVGEDDIEQVPAQERGGRRENEVPVRRPQLGELVSRVQPV